MNTPENIPNRACGNKAAIVANASVSADFVSKVSHRMIAKLTTELVSMEKNCPVSFDWRMTNLVCFVKHLLI